MFCPKCGNSSLEGGSFCTNCGNPLTSPSVSTPGASTPVTTVVPPVLTMEYVGFFPRVGAFLIDYILLTLVLAVVASGLRLLFLPGIGPQDQGYFIGQVLFSLLLAILIWWPYFIVSSVKFGGTVGKLILGQMVVNENGEKIDWGQALLRYLVGYGIIDSLTLGLGYLWVAFDSKKQGFHDKIAKTYVVKRPEGKSRTAGIGCLTVGIISFILLIILSVITVLTQRTPPATIQEPQFQQFNQRW